MKRVLLLLVILVLTGCQERKETETQGPTLHLTLQTEPISLDPGVGGNKRSRAVVRMIFEGLLHLDSNGNPIPALAEKVTLSEDKKTYTFTLRDTKWSDGTPVTAHDFEYGWKRNVSRDFDTAFSFAFYPIKNAKEAREQGLALEEVGVKAVDDHTLIVELKYPAPYFLELVADPMYAPVPRHVAERDAKWSTHSGTEFVCNGPFCLDTWEHNKVLEVVPNPYYWNKEAVKLGRVSIAIVDDPNTALLMYQQGELDWLGEPFGELPLAAIPSLKEAGDLQFRPNGGVFWYRFNLTKPPFQSLAMRKAFVYAINRDQIVKHVLQSGEQPAFEALPMGLNLNETPAFKDGDIEEAQRLFAEGLAELGLSKEQLPPITISYSNIAADRSVAETIQQQWSEAFGIPIQIEGREWAAYFVNLRTGQYQIAGTNWYSWYADPTFNLEQFRYTAGAKDDVEWGNLKYITLLDEANQEENPQVRKKLLKEAQTILLEEAPFAPIYLLIGKYLKSDDLHDVAFSNLGGFDITWASKQ